jgi:hypothetical protein
MFSISPLISFSSKISTDAASARIAFHVQVFAAKRMSFLTMHPVQNREVHSSHGIHLRSDSFKVQWIHAFTVRAPMIYLKSLWNVAKEKFISISVGVNLLGMGNRVPAVAKTITVTSSSPQPATRFSINRNLLSKTLRQSVNFNAKHNGPHGSENATVGAIAFGW